MCDKVDKNEFALWSFYQEFQTVYSHLLAAVQNQPDYPGRKQCHNIVAESSLMEFVEPEGCSQAEIFFFQPFHQGKSFDFLIVGLNQGPNSIAAGCFQLELKKKIRAQILQNFELTIFDGNQIWIRSIMLLLIVVFIWSSI